MRVPSVAIPKRCSARRTSDSIVTACASSHTAVFAHGMHIDPTSISTPAHPHNNELTRLLYT
eukprot:7173224-Pyramimonas_sp.AAC.1